MQNTLIAASGIAEAGWAIASAILWGGIAILWISTLLTWVATSRKLAVFSVVLLIVLTWYLEPWHCLSPFPAHEYDDPDVVAAAERFHRIGMWWIFTSVFVAVSSAFVWWKKSQLVARRAEQSRGINSGEQSHQQ